MSITIASKPLPKGDVSATFFVEKKDVDSGQFSIDALTIFTRNTGAKVHIRGQQEIACIDSGVVRYKQ